MGGSPKGGVAVHENQSVDPHHPPRLRDTFLPAKSFTPSLSESVVPLSSVFGFDFGVQAAARGEVSGNLGVERLAGGDDISKNAVDGVLVEDAQVSVFLDVHFQGLQFQALPIRAILNRDCSEVRQSGLGANGGVFRIDDSDVVTGKLVRPAFNRGQNGVDAGFGVIFVVRRLIVHPVILLESEENQKPPCASCTWGLFT